MSPPPMKSLAGNGSGAERFRGSCLLLMREVCPSVCGGPLSTLAKCRYEVSTPCRAIVSLIQLDLRVRHVPHRALVNRAA
jgi:hypothetical protein